MDAWLPSLQLAFEYQERHHYTSAEYADLPLDAYKARDAAKRDLARSKGISLVIVPCWWDGKEER